MSEQRRGPEVISDLAPYPAPSQPQESEMRIAALEQRITALETRLTKHIQINDARRRYGR